MILVHGLAPVAVMRPSYKSYILKPTIFLFFTSYRYSLSFKIDRSVCYSCSKHTLIDSFFLRCRQQSTIVFKTQASGRGRHVVVSFNPFVYCLSFFRPIGFIFYQHAPQMHGQFSSHRSDRFLFDTPIAVTNPPKVLFGLNINGNPLPCGLNECATKGRLPVPIDGAGCTF